MHFKIGILIDNSNYKECEAVYDARDKAEKEVAAAAKAVKDKLPMHDVIGIVKEYL